ncbi:MAG: lipoyltransferase [Muribaculaceae bacterium]|nr:lipoyltransferase [Muribaculaceae bacterium]
MKHVLLPDVKVRPLQFYLAMEEYLAALSADEDYFFMWQVNPTVIIGRNQHLVSEVNLDYCRSHLIDIVRRRSGGGCVYADMNNVMLSYITTSDAVTTTFGRYTAMVADVLCRLGIDARAGGRNDIMIGDRKVSGNAFYHRRGRAIVHGTMLYDTDIDAMLRAITPSSRKLTAKGVESVRSRVINLSEVSDITLPEFKRRAAEMLCDSTMTLTPDDVERIEELALNYTKPGWLAGNRTHAAATSREHIDGVGELELSVELNGPVIERVGLMGDFFLLSDLDSSLLDRLKGVEYTPAAVTNALARVDVSQVIASLSTSKFIELLF